VTLPLLRRTRRGAASGVVATLLVAATVAAGGQWAAAQTPPEPGVGGDVGELAELVAVADEPIGVSGEEAVELLDETGTTELAAENAGMEPDELVEELIEDPTMFVTADAMVGYAEVAPPAEQLSGTDVLTRAALTAPPGDVFNLNSRPSSGKVIYLDVDGHVTTGDFWNSPSVAGVDPIVSAPYVDRSSVSASQRDDIYEIWQRVSEDFLPFDVNVTTRDPGVDGLRNTGANDQNYGRRMVISPSNWVGAGTLGIALLDVFDEDFDHSTFVFTAGRSARVIAETVSHEAGHTLGLRHDGTTALPDYYDGHGNWAPIMGRPVSSNALVTQWSIGEYADANNREDDIVGIATYTGFRVDDDVCTSVVGSTSTTAGNIGAGGDRDAFAVDLGVGSATVTLRPSLTGGSNLHAQVTVRDAAGAVVGAGSAPMVVTNWTSAATFNVPTPGRYFIEVTPTGWLAPTNGFSTYGSMGEYQLQVAGVATAAGPAIDCADTSGFTAVTPARLLDTRIGQGGSLRIPAGGQIALQVTGRGGVPVGATAAVLSVVADDPAGGGFLTTFPCTPTRPIASTVNFIRGQTVANTAISTLSPSGRLCIFALTATEVVVDVTGYLSRGVGSRFTAVGPTRVMDTRSGLGGAGRVPTGGTVSLPASAFPTGATAVALNVTSDAASGAGFATVYPCAAGRSGTSTINFVAADTRPNNTIVGVSGGVCIYAMTSTEIVVDLVGYFGAAGLSYLPAAPTRLLDTRETVGYRPPAGTVSYRPATASLGAFSAVSAAVNVTAVDHVAGGYVTTFDCNTLTTTSALNAVAGEVNANGAIVPLDSGVDSCLFTQSGGNFVVDLSGWWVR